MCKGLARPTWLAFLRSEWAIGINVALADSALGTSEFSFMTLLPAEVVLGPTQRFILGQVRMIPTALWFFWFLVRWEKILDVVNVLRDFLALIDVVDEAFHDGGVAQLRHVFDN